MLLTIKVLKIKNKFIFLLKSLNTLEAYLNQKCFLPIYCCLMKTNLFRTILKLVLFSRIQENEKCQLNLLLSTPLQFRDLLDFLLDVDLFLLLTIFLISIKLIILIILNPTNNINNGLKQDYNFQKNQIVGSPLVVLNFRTLKVRKLQ